MILLSRRIGALCLIMLCLFLTTGAAAQTVGAKPQDNSVIMALHQATRDIIDPHQQVETLAWLSKMSHNVRKRLPNDFYRVRLMKTILTEAKRADLDPQLVLAVIDVESNFDRYAVSRVGAQGLMQVMPFWKDILGSYQDDLFNPQINIRYGCTILKHYIDRFAPSLDRALAAYNGSLGRTTYSDKVKNRLKKEWQFQPFYSLDETRVAQSETSEVDARN